jgi:microcystin degradation protein MlrC
MRIAIAGISVETGNFSTLPTTQADFGVFAGSALRKAGDELLSVERYPFLSKFDAEFVFVFFAGALPGGPMDPDAYRHFKEQIVTGLQAAGPLDGVYLDLHGAMYVDGMEDAEGDLALAVRETVGPTPLIAASMDLHGNITPAFVSRLNLLTAYRTAPHRDTVETRERACRLLVEAIANGERPQIFCLPIPVLLSGEQTRTDMEPGASLWAALDGYSQPPAILDASLFVGFAWVDERRAHAAAVVSGSDPVAMRNAATRIAQSYWNARREFHFGVPSGTIDDCIRRALAAPESTVFISDSGDNVTAGAPGDLPIFLERLLAHQSHGLQSALVAGLADAQAVAICRQAGVNAHVRLALGGKLDPIHAASLDVEGTVLQVSAASGKEGDQAVVQVGNVAVILTARRQAFTEEAAFRAAGVDPLAYKIVVVKLGYLFPDLLRIAPAALMALSPGASSLYLERLPYQRIERPMYPLDKEFAWSPGQ